jgi:hypothetical protein
MKTEFIAFYNILLFYSFFIQLYLCRFLKKKALKLWQPQTKYISNAATAGTLQAVAVMRAVT